MEKYRKIWERASRDLASMNRILKKEEEGLYLEEKDLQEKIKGLMEGLSETEDDLLWQYGKEMEINQKRLLYLKEKQKILKEKSGSPYFSKVVPGGGYFEEGFFISKDISDPDNAIIKYTAPLAVLRYRDIGETEIINNQTYQLKEKELLQIEKKELKELNYSGEGVTFVCTARSMGERVMKDPDQVAPKEPLVKDEKKYVLGEIIAQMQEEQDRIMRAPYQGLTLLKGAPGSGKTNIAFHRIVYLVSEHPSSFRQESMAVFCFNVALKKYLMKMLTDLNIPEVKVFSLDQWFYNLLKKVTNIGWLNYKERPRERFVKTRKEVLPILEDFLVHYEEELMQTLKGKPGKGTFDAYEILSLLYEYTPFLEYISPGGVGLRGRYSERREVDSSDQYLLAYLIEGISKSLNINLFLVYDHIVVDEAQDVMPIQMALIHKLHHDSMTLVGDVAQRIFPFGVDSWDQFPLEMDRVYELKICHRSTLQTISFANTLMTQKDDVSLPKKVGQRGEKPLLSIGESRDHVYKRAVEIIQGIKKDEPEASMVVVNYRSSDLKEIQDRIDDGGIDCYIASKANWEFSSRVAITTYHQVKGLEFDYILLLGLNEYERIYDETKEQVIYTVVTRTQKRIFILCIKRIPQMLEGIDGDFYHLEEGSL